MTNVIHLLRCTQTSGCFDSQVQSQDDSDMLQKIIRCFKLSTGIQMLTDMTNDVYSKIQKYCHLLQDKMDYLPCEQPHWENYNILLLQSALDVRNLDVHILKDSKIWKLITIFSFKHVIYKDYLFAPVCRNTSFR